MRNSPEGPTAARVSHRSTAVPSEVNEPTAPGSPSPTSSVSPSHSAVATTSSAAPGSDGARAVQERFLAGDYPGAMAAVPLEFLDATSLLGPRERIAERMTAFAEAGATTLNLMPVGPGLPGPDRAADALRVAVEAAELAGLSTAARVPDGPRPPRPHDAPDVHDLQALDASTASQVPQGETRTHDHA